MARTLAELPKGARITDYMSLGVLTSPFKVLTDGSIRISQ